MKRPVLMGLFVAALALIAVTLVGGVGAGTQATKTPPIMQMDCDDCSGG